MHHLVAYIISIQKLQDHAAFKGFCLWFQELQSCLMVLDILMFALVCDVLAFLAGVCALVVVPLVQHQYFGTLHHQPSIEIDQLNIEILEGGYTMLNIGLRSIKIIMEGRRKCRLRRLQWSDHSLTVKPAVMT